ncbi:MAG: type IX secretion system membrane protein PorP/SprF [Bacteroidetes bacterium]|nr:MAG: type IX secretion system membrane protein PorP/SprF [Bacteroidota bacterium]
MQRTFTRLLFLGTVFFSVQSYGQFAPYYTHYMLNKLAYNPATAGEKDAICVNALSHTQWLGQSAQDPSGFDLGNSTATNSRVNPTTQSISITAPILKNKNLGLGFVAVNDKIGYLSTLYLRGSVAYKHGFGRKIPSDNARGYNYDQTLSIGMDFGMVNLTQDGSKYMPIDPTDPQIPNTKVSDGSFDLGAGIYYSNQSLFNGFYTGISMAHLTKPVVTAENAFSFTTERYIHFLAGSEHDLGSISLLPSVMVRTLGGGGVQVDLSARAKMGQKLVLGAGVRSGDAIYLMLGYYIKNNLYAGYSYDFNALSSSTLKYTKAGTHEIFISYCFDMSFTPPIKTVKPRYNVRYLEGYSY